jgi:hypothetical protein
VANRDVHQEILDAQSSESPNIQPSFLRWSAHCPHVGLASNMSTRLCDHIAEAVCYVIVPLYPERAVRARYSVIAILVFHFAALLLVLRGHVSAH